VPAVFPRQPDEAPDCAGRFANVLKRKHSQLHATGFPRKHAGARCCPTGTPGLTRIFAGEPILGSGSVEGESGVRTAG
jgi:hypothetical protein